MARRSRRSTRAKHRRVSARPRWPRRILISLNVVVAVLLVGAASVYGYTRYQIDSIKTGSNADLSSGEGSSKDVTQAAGGLQPENILLIGNETRAGQTEVNFGNSGELTGTLSDVIMVLHLDPKAGTASLLSIPRDVFTPMPAGSPVGSWQKIDAALNDGKLGPNNLAAAITQDFGIPIDHYVEVDFDGFLQTVNALGGIKLDFPERLYDAYSNLDIDQTGCQLIHGQQALALVRSRHLQYDPPSLGTDDISAWPYDPESDLARITRDQTFLRVLVKTAESKGFSNPITANNFLSAILGQLTVDPGLKGQLLSLIERYDDLNPATAPTTTIPVTQVTGDDGNGYVYQGYNVGDVEFPDEPADTETIEKWDPGALPTPVKPAAVEVFNDAGTDGLASQIGSALTGFGFHVTAETNGPIPADVSETVVQYHPGQLAAGFAVFQKLTGAVILQQDASAPAGTVEVQAGSTLGVVAAPSAAPSTTAAPSSSSTTSTSGATTTTVPTPGGQAASSANAKLTPYDPRPC